MRSTRAWSACRRIVTDLLGLSPRGSAAEVAQRPCEYSTKLVRNTPSSLTADRPRFRLTKRREEHKGNELHPSPSAPPEWQRRAMRKHSDPPLCRPARQTRKPRLHPGAFLSTCVLNASRSRERHAGPATSVRPEQDALLPGRSVLHWSRVAVSLMLLACYHLEHREWLHESAPVCC